MINVTIWNEYIHEKEYNSFGEYIRKIYPQGIHSYLAQALMCDNFNITAVSLDMPEQGLTDELLENTDVLLWWGHVAHDKVSDQLVEKIRQRILLGMGLIVLHSGHFSKIFRTMMGTSCRLRWREVGEKERLWVVAPNHPICKDIPETFELPNSEMYGERFDVPDDGKIIFMSWYEGGNVFRSGVTFQRDGGKIFYFSPGHESYPIYHDKNIQKILTNAINWAKSDILPPRVTPLPDAYEKIYTKNPLSHIDAEEIHAIKK